MKELEKSVVVVRGDTVRRFPNEADAIGAAEAGDVVARLVPIGTMLSVGFCRLQRVRQAKSGGDE